jgi:hypothetical protein
MTFLEKEGGRCMGLPMDEKPKILKTIIFSNHHEAKLCFSLGNGDGISLTDRLKKNSC